MSFVISNNNNEYIYIYYMKNIFKLRYKKDLWKDFTNLYYDKMINLESLFQLSNSKNLYIHINHNKTLEFKDLNIFKDIKNIIKKNLNDQLQDWEININIVNPTIGIKSLLNNKNRDISPSITPETNLEKIISYIGSNEEELDNNNFYNYLTYESEVHKPKAIEFMSNPINNKNDNNTNDKINLKNKIIDIEHKEVFLIDERCELKISDIDSEYSII